MNETYQQPGRWHDIILTEATTASRINSEDPSERIMSHQLQALEPSSIYETIVQAKNRYGWSEVRSYYTHIIPLLVSVSSSVVSVTFLFSSSPLPNARPTGE